MTGTENNQCQHDRFGAPDTNLTGDSIVRLIRLDFDRCNEGYKCLNSWEGRGGQVGGSLG